MALASIVIDLLMRTASFETDSKRAEKRMAELGKSAQRLGATIGSALSAGAFVAYTNKIIDGLDALNDAADATGASVENLSALEDIGARTGTSFDTATAMLVKFNNVLKEADGKNAASQILQRMGLDLAKLKAMDPAEAMHVFAKSMAQFASDGDRARVVQEFFGKSVRETAPFLKDMAEQGALNATVTKEQAEAAETFNRELFAMQKNVTDLARDIMGDVIPALNEFAKGVRDGGIVEGLKAMFGGTEEFKANKRFADLTNDLLIAQNNLLKVKAEHEKWWVAGTGKSIEFWDGEVARIQKELAALAALRNPAFTNDSFRKSELAYKPSIGSVPTSPIKTPTGDPNADFKSYLNNLEQQIQKVKELTVSQKLLDDIRRGSLTVTPAQKAQLTALASEVDRMKALEAAAKSAMDVAKARQDQRNKDNDDAVAGLREIEVAERAWIKAATDNTPIRQMEIMIETLAKLDKALENGLDPEVWRQARLGVQGLTQANTEGLTKAEDFTLALSEQQQALLDIGQLGADALSAMVVGGEEAGDALANLGRQLANLAFQLLVIQPMMNMLKTALGAGGTTPPNPDASIWGSVLSLAGGFFGGARAGGGDVIGGRSYLVGENGPERFTPRASGRIDPSGGGRAPVNIYMTNQYGDIASKSEVVAMQEANNRRLLGALDRRERYGR